MSPGRSHMNPGRSRGFSLIEVLVALVIIAVGMLGIAKMHALALESTGSAGTRSLIAIETAGLAMAMHANRDYWSSTGNSPTNVNVAGGVAAIDPASALSGIASCATGTGHYLSTATPCTNNAALAAYDVQNFGAALAQIVPAANADIVCGPPVPQSCTITVTWVENIAGMTNAASSTVISSAAVSAPTSNFIQQPQYVLYVEP